MVTGHHYLDSLVRNNLQTSAKIQGHMHFLERVVQDQKPEGFLKTHLSQVEI